MQGRLRKSEAIFTFRVSRISIPTWPIWRKSQETEHYSLFINDMQRFSGNIFATRCCSLMGVSPLVLEYLLQSCRTVGLVLLEKFTENLCISLVNRL